MRANRWLIALAASLSPAQLGAEPPKAPPAPFLEHVGIYVSDTQKTARFFTDVMGLRVNTVWWAVQPDAKGQGGLKLSFVDGNGMQFTLIEPTSPGPAADDMARLGDGSLAELDYEVPDFDAEYDFHKRNGIRFVTMGGAPFPDGQKGWTVEPYGLRLVYLPQSVTHGIVTELYQRGPAATDILEKRDLGWKPLPPLAPDAPRLIRTLVLVEALDRSSAFMANVLRLPLIERLETDNGMSCARFASGRGTEVELVRPPAGSALAAQLHAKGDGFLAGLLYQSVNPDETRQRLRSKGIRLLGPSQAEAMALTPGCLDGARQADWIAIHPKDSTGIRIAIVPSSSKP